MNYCIFLLNEIIFIFIRFDGYYFDFEYWHKFHLSYQTKSQTSDRFYQLSDRFCPQVIALHKGDGNKK